MSDQAPITVDRVELVRVALPLVRPFRTSFGTQSARDVLLVRAGDGELDGWGEVVTPAAPVYSSEYTDGAASVLADHLVPRVLGRGPLRAEDVARVLAPIKGHRMAKAALEAAILDLQLRRDGVSFASTIGATRDRVPCGVSVGIPEAGIDVLVEQVAGYLEQGYLRVKVKVEPGFDVQPLRAVREAFPQVMLWADANAAYGLEDAAHLAKLDELGLGLLEQPLPEERVRDHAELARRLQTPICLDESIVDTAAAIDALELRACSVVNIKAGRVGGYLEAVRVHDACRARDVPVWCGGMLETGIGRGANLALAALPGFTLPGDTSASDRYFAQDLTAPFVLEDGHLPVPAEPGLSRPPLPDVLAAHTSGTRVLQG